jgi:hypothetical protein
MAGSIFTTSLNTTQGYICSHANETAATGFSGQQKDPDTDKGIRSAN